MTFRITRTTLLPICFVFWFTGVTNAVLPNTRAIAITGQPTPDANGVLAQIGFPSVNSLGQVAFLANIDGSDVGEGEVSTVHSVFVGDGSTVMTIAQTGQPLPGDGTIRELYGKFAGIRSGTPSLNAAGQVSFRSLAANDEGDFGGVGIYLSDGNEISQIVFPGEAVPDDSGIFHSNPLFPFDNPFSVPLLNNRGHSAFWASLIEGQLVEDEDKGCVDRDSGIFLRHELGITQIVRWGDESPDGNGTFGCLTLGSFNDNGEVLFFADLKNSNVGFRDDEALFVGAEMGVSVVAREGDAVTERSSLGRPDYASINNSGAVAFSASLSGEQTDYGIFLKDGESQNLLESLVVSSGQEAPDGNGTFSRLRQVALDDLGRVAFVTDLANSTGEFNDGPGLYVFGDSIGLLQVARKGDAFLGSTIATLGGVDTDVSGDTTYIGFHFSLADGRQGVALSEVVPEPTCGIQAMMVVLVAMARKRRR